LGAHFNTLGFFFFFFLVILIKSNVSCTTILHNFCTTLTTLIFYDQPLDLFSYMWVINI